MDKNNIFSILNDWNFWHQELKTGVSRADYLERLTSYLKTNQIIVMTGPRRAGKSFLMRQAIKRLMEQGVPSSQTLMINFEDPRWPKLDTGILQKIYEAYLEKFNPQIPFLFLDEIQEVENWEKWVSSLQERGKAKLVLSGSNAKLLSRELSTLLTGRHLPLEVLPFSFREQIRFLETRQTLPSHPDELRLLQGRVVEQMLEFGSFPEVIQSETKREILFGYFDDILNKDLIRRHQIRKTENFKSLARFYLSQIASPVTYNSVKKFLSLSTDTVEKFSTYLEEVYLLFFLKRFSFKVREQEKSPRKVYAVDTGLANAVGFRQGQNRGRLAENAVLIELLRRKSANPQIEVYYWKNEQQWEIDFVIREALEITQLIQVCWDLSDPRVKQRETRALAKGLDIFGLKEGLVVTSEEEGMEKINGKKIRLVPLFQWLAS